MRVPVRQRSSIRTARLKPVAAGQYANLKANEAASRFISRLACNNNVPANLEFSGDIG